MTEPNTRVSVSLVKSVETAGTQNLFLFFSFLYLCIKSSFLYSIVLSVCIYVSASIGRSLDGSVLRFILFHFPKLVCMAATAQSCPNGLLTRSVSMMLFMDNDFSYCFGLTLGIYTHFIYCLLDYVIHILIIIRGKENPQTKPTHSDDELFPR